MKNSILILFILTTNLNAQNWYAVNSNSTDLLDNIVFTNNNIGYCLAYNGSSGTILKTSDQGENWNSIFSIPELINSIYFKDSKNGFVSTENHLYKTTDGENFEDKTNDFDIESYSVVGINDVFKENIGLVQVTYQSINNPSDISYKCFKTIDFGITWAELGNYNFTNQGNFYIVDNNTFYYTHFNLKKTTNNGDTWEIVQNIGFSFPPFKKTLRVSSSNIGVSILGYNYDYIVFDLNSPTSVINYIDNAFYKSFHFNDNVGYFIQGSFIGGQDHFYKTTDNGATLNEVHFFSGLESALYDIYFIDDNVGFVVGENGTILKTTTGGMATRDIDPKDNIKIYPNPSKNILVVDTISQQKLDKLKVTDTSGKIIHQQKICNSKTEINTTKFPTGIYFISVEENGKTLKTEKIIKQ